MSYAQAAAQGANQNLDEARAPISPKVDSEASSSLVDVDTPHVATVPPDYEEQDVKTRTQAERLDREEERVEQAIEAGAEKGKERAKHAKGKAKAAMGHGKETASGFCERLMRNKSNPVVVANAVLIAAAGAGFGYGAYQRQLHRALTWDLFAVWTGGLGAVGAVDYFVSKWFLQNKYPAK